MEEQVIAIYSATPSEGRDSWVRSLELKDIARYERELLEYIRTRHGDVLKSIRETEKLEEDVESKLQEALDEFANVFAPSSGAGQTA